MAILIKKAVKYDAKLRMALYGPSGSGKTYTALAIAHALAGDKKVIVIDTEHGSASKYADVFPEFDVIELDSFHPNTYVEAINAVVRAGEYGVLVVDSATHEWDGTKGALEMAGRDFTNWAKVTPQHNEFVNAMISADIHIIATMRAKEEYEMVKGEGQSKASVRKIGMEPIQRKGVQYEFDVVGSLDIDNLLTIEKTRCSALHGKTFMRAGQEIATILSSWLKGAPAPAPTLSGIFKTGMQKKSWNAENFYASASAILGGIPVSKETALSPEQLQSLMEAAKSGPVALAANGLAV